MEEYTFGLLGIWLYKLLLSTKCTNCYCLQNEQILTEYRILARDYHPDKNGSDGAKEKFCMLQQAKEVLVDQQASFLCKGVYSSHFAEKIPSKK